MIAREFSGHRVIMVQLADLSENECHTLVLLTLLSRDWRPDAGGCCCC